MGNFVEELAKLLKKHDKVLHTQYSITAKYLDDCLKALNEVIKLRESQFKESGGI